MATGDLTLHGAKPAAIPNSDKFPAVQLTNYSKPTTCIRDLNTKEIRKLDSVKDTRAQASAMQKAGDDASAKPGKHVKY